MKLYKVINKQAKAKDAGNFDYTKYLPKNNKAGKWTPKIKNIAICERGYHITPYWNMYVESQQDLIFEVEVKGLVEETNEIGVVDKYVCESIRLVKQLFPTYDVKSNTGDSNTGYWNTGDWNTGDSNTGHRNTGDSNTGHRNTGDSNTGDRNTGDWNTGDRNTGDWNTGDSNTGDWNTGDSNTGHRNTGDWNTGHRNTGHSNTGYWNTCDDETGFFNSTKVETIRVFNKYISKELWDNCDKPNFIYFDLIDDDYKKSFITSFNKIKDKREIDLLLKLPNFDYKVFEEISGISKKMIDNKLNEVDEK